MFDGFCTGGGGLSHFRDVPNVFVGLKQKWRSKFNCLYIFFLYFLK